MARRELIAAQRTNLQEAGATRTNPAGWPPGADEPGDLPTRVWRLFAHPLALWLPCLLLLLLGLAGLLLPQMPGQLQSEPAGALRWLESTAQGPLSSVWRGLGLYQIQTHPVLLVGLLGLFLTLAIRLARLWGVAQAHTYLDTQAATLATHAPGCALEMEPNADLIQLWARTEKPLADLEQEIDTLLAQSGISDVKQIRMPFAAAAAIEAGTAAPRMSATAETEPIDSTTGFDVNVEAMGQEHEEVRFFYSRNRGWGFGSLVRDGGLLLALLGIWIVLVFGWQVATPVLAPGERFLAPRHNLEIRHALGSSSQGERLPTILVRHNETTFELEGMNHRQMLGDLLLTTRPGAPGLLLSTAPGTNIFRPLGRDETVSQLGLVFPTSGSEETLLLPELAAGLRIARRQDAQTPWVVEFYGAGDVQPRERWELPAGPISNLQLPETGLTIDIEPIAGAIVQAQQMPGYWLFWLGIAIALIGGALHLRQPFFALIQLGPWYGESVLVIQTTRRADPVIAQLQQNYSLRASDVTESGTQRPIPQP